MKKSKKKQAILELLFLVANLLPRQCKAMPGGLTLRQYMLLSSMKEMQSANLSSLSKVFGGTRQNIRQLVDALHEKGYVILAQSEYDKREIRVSLTEKALQFFAENEDADEILLQPAFKGIGEKSLDGAMQCLEKMAANLESTAGTE